MKRLFEAILGPLLGAMGKLLIGLGIFKFGKLKQKNESLTTTLDRVEHGNKIRRRVRKRASKRVRGKSDK